MPTSDSQNGGATIPNFPWKIVNSIPWEIVEHPMCKERFIQECAITLLGNVDFNNTKIPIEMAVIDCVKKANVMAKALESTFSTTGNTSKYEDNESTDNSGDNSGNNSGSSNESSGNYLWVKFAQSLSGDQMSNSYKNEKYIGFGIYKDNEMMSDNATDYSWYKLNSITTGITNFELSDNLYIFIKFAGVEPKFPTSSITDAPQIGDQYVGILISNKKLGTNRKSNFYLDYKWCKIGDKGIKIN